MENESDNRLRIGLFDSGIGGLSILKEVQKLLPHADYFYCADDQNAPYGNLSPEQIALKTSSAIKTLMEKEVHLVIVACNTATAFAIDVLREQYSLPFIGVEPYVNVIHKEELDASKNKIGILTTNATGESRRFKTLLKRFDPDELIIPLKSSKMALLIEQIFVEGWTDKITAEMDRELAVIRSISLTHLVLGCTHYPLIADYIRKETGVIIISPCSFVANRVLSVASVLGDFDTVKRDERVEFFFSSKREWKKENISSMLGALQYPGQ